MDFNFHYCAVKTLAHKAGFVEEDAQLIAEYSQFVDDFDMYKNLWLQKVPDYARSLATSLPVGWVFYTATTGFNRWDDMARLIVEHYQEKISVPFHFIPCCPLSQLQGSRVDLRVIPADPDAPSLISLLMDDAKNIYRKEQSRESLIRIGLLLHIFADTYAHQKFSGFQGWENHCWLKNVTSNLNNNEDLTEEFSPKKYHELPAVGHSEAGHVPDLSYLRFELSMKATEDDDAYSLTYVRNNTDEFTLAARKILSYLTVCRDEEKIILKDWDDFSEQFRKGLLTDESDHQKLFEHWRALFPDVVYSYDKTQLMGALPADTKNKVADLSMGNRTDDFFRYNVIADNVRDKVRS